MKKILHQVFSFVLMILFFSSSAQDKTSLSPDGFESACKANRNVQLLDVRTPGEFSSGHINNALLADWNNKEEFNRRINYIDKNKPVLIYCLAGGRSAAAAEKMRGMGFKEVYELKGGINAWKAAGKALAGSSATKQMSFETFNKAMLAPGYLLVNFGAEWCPPCRIMEPVIKRLQQNKNLKFSLLKVDGGNDLNVMKEYSVTALPVFIIFKDGKQLFRKEGVATEVELEEHLK